jgi:hypothetical protein
MSGLVQAMMRSIMKNVHDWWHAAGKSMPAFTTPHTSTQVDMFSSRKSG